MWVGNGFMGIEFMAFHILQLGLCTVRSKSENEYSPDPNQTSENFKTNSPEPN